VVAIDSDNESEENKSRKKQQMADVDTILVEGCGIPDVNGTYTWSDELYIGACVYCKQGQWKGKNAWYEMFCEDYVSWKCWVISANISYLYHGPRGGSAEMPSNGWNSEERVNPTPKLKCK